MDKKIKDLFIDLIKDKKQKELFNLIFDKENSPTEDVVKLIKENKE